MVELCRTVRFCVGPGFRWADVATTPRHNTFAGWPSMRGLGAHYELEVRCAGEPDQVTGYLLNISAIDALVRERALPLIFDAFLQRPQPNPAATLRSVVAAVEQTLNSKLISICWRLSPYHGMTMATDDLDRVVVSQQFEFAAAHRLHVAALGSQANREVFGRCNNPSGHGHNYRLDVAVSIPVTALDADESGSSRLQSLERIVDETLIKRFDHKHLNLDTQEFARTNPSVENIAKVCHDLLREPLDEAGFRLVRVTLWETEKTSCSYPGPER